MRISDCSSDVCSSDLARGLTCRWWHTSFDLLNLSLLRQRCAPSRCALRQEKPSPSSSASTSWRRGAAWISAARTLMAHTTTERSEERSVGKEGVSTCRSRWWTYQYKKKKIKDTIHSITTKL